MKRFIAARIGSRRTDVVWVVLDCRNSVAGDICTCEDGLRATAIAAALNADSSAYDKVRDAEEPF
ncbi:MAG TPA: hypothetical protein VGB14_01720 [Acidimicrobiales bacterium]|jgi:hypothetical protein